MSVTITPLPDTDYLHVSGDIEQTFAIPRQGACGDYVICLSDGTLLKGTANDGEDAAISVQVEGAAIVRQADNGVIVEWPVEWLTVAASAMSVTPIRQPSYLPLFPHCGG